MKQTGLTLIELMISMVLGLLLLAGVSNLFQANRQTFQNNQGLSQIQEAVRTSFGVLSRELRQSGYTKCGNSAVASILNSSSNDNLLKWRGIYGVDANVNLAPVVTGTNTGERVANTSAILVQGLEDIGNTIAQHDSANGHIVLNGTAMPFKTSDIVMICDYSQASIFQINAINANKLTYNQTSASPGNCQMGLGLPGGCGATIIPRYIAYSPNSSVERLLSSIWYIGNNGRAEEGGRSLYRMRLSNQGQIVTEEIVAGISDMQIDYHIKNNAAWLTAANVDAASHGWASVDAIRLRLTIISSNSNLGSSRTDGRLQRSFTQTLALRNRV